MTSVNVMFRPSSKAGRHPGSLTLRLIHCRRVKCITLKGCRLYPDEWDGYNQAIIYPKNDPERTAYLEKMEQLISREINQVATYLPTLQKQGRYTVEDLARHYRQGKDDGKLCGYMEILAHDMEKRGQVRTARAYRTVVRGIVDFNKGKDIPLVHINARLIKDFEGYLKSAGKLPNTISYYMRNLRAIYNKAIAEKRINRNRDENPFTGVYTGITKTRKRALSLEELKKIKEIDFASLLEKEACGTNKYARIKNLDMASRYFYFSFYARGMCFVDVAYLRKDNIRGGIIRYVRKKTGQQIEVRITREMQAIIDSFSDQVKDSSYVFPLINHAQSKVGKRDIRLQYETALRTQNNRLKKLSSLAGVTKTISTHWARHSWATIGKKENVPLQVLSECLGHSSEKTTMIYLGQLDNSVLDAANDLIASVVVRAHSSIPSSLLR